MAIVNEDLAPLGDTNESSYRRTIIPNNLTGSYVANDTDDHEFHVDARGKGRMTVVIENPSDKTVTTTVYGCHAIDDAVGDDGVMEIGGSGVSAFDTLTTESNYECYNDPFPFYIVSCTSGDTPDGETVVVNITLQQQ